MTITKKVSIGLVCLLVGLTAYFSFPVAKSFANTFAWQRQASCQSAPATTTLSFSSSATVTTLICDMNAGTATGAEFGVLSIYRTASSTASATKITFEYSDDYVASTGNGTWYSDKVSNFDGFAATTTQTVAFTGFNSITWNFASTTLGGVSATTTQDSMKFKFPVVARYVRVVFTQPSGALNFGYWAEIVGKKQNP